VKTAHRLLLLLLALLAGGCGNPRDEAAARLRSVPAVELRNDAARLHTQFLSAPGQQHVPLMPFHWPESTKKLEPVRVNLYRDGLAIALRLEPGVEFGIHVLPLGVNAPPAASPHVQYERIEDGIYFYTLQR
jgi:hypothetical protein